MSYQYDYLASCKKLCVQSLDFIFIHYLYFSSFSSNFPIRIFINCFYFWFFLQTRVGEHIIHCASHLVGLLLHIHSQCLKINGNSPTRIYIWSILTWCPETLFSLGTTIKAMVQFLWKVEHNSIVLNPQVLKHER